MTPDSCQELRSLSELDLMKRIALKDEAALAELFSRFQLKVLNLAYRHMGNREDAELITQDVFLRIWRHAQSYRGSSQVWTWIYRVTVNACLSHKSRKKIPTNDLNETMPADAGTQPDVVYARDKLQAIVQHALASLPPDQRMAIVLSRYEGLSYDEIAQAMNKSRNAVATLLFRAREQLKVKLTPYVKRGELSP